MKIFPQLFLLLTLCSSHNEAPSSALCATDILYLFLWSTVHSILCYWLSVNIFKKLFPQLCLLPSFCTCHYVALTINFFAKFILYVSLWKSFHSSLCYWHFVHDIMNLIPQFSELLTFCSRHYESPTTFLGANFMWYNLLKAPSTSLWATIFLNMSLRSYFHSSVFYWHSVTIIIKVLPPLLCYWNSVTLFMKLRPQSVVILSFCTCHYEAPFTALCGTDFQNMSLWSSFHNSLWYWHSVPVIMKVVPQLCVPVTFCTFNYEAPSSSLGDTDILYLSLWSSFQCSVCYCYSVPLIIKLLPNFYVLMTFCSCIYEAPSTVLCVSNIMYLSLLSSFYKSLCYWLSVYVMKLFLHTALCIIDILYLSLWSSNHSNLCYGYSVPIIMKLLLKACMLLKFCTCQYEV